MTTPIDLPDIGRRIAAQLDSHFDPAQARTRQVLALVEEAGEFADAYVVGDSEPIAAELADVLITAHVTAAVFGVDLDDVPLAAWRSNAFPDRQVINVAAAACAVAGAYRRAAGMARRSGPIEDVAIHLVDVVLATQDAANRQGIDLDAAVAAKVDVVFTRGWREPPALPPPPPLDAGDPDWVAGFGPVPGSGLE